MSIKELKAPNATVPGTRLHPYVMDARKDELSAVQIERLTALYNAREIFISPADLIGYHGFFAMTANGWKELMNISATLEP